MLQVKSECEVTCRRETQYVSNRQGISIELFQKRGREMQPLFFVFIASFTLSSPPYTYKTYFATPHTLNIGKRTTEVFRVFSDNLFGRQAFFVTSFLPSSCPRISSLALAVISPSLFRCRRFGTSFSACSNAIRICSLASSIR